MNGNHLKQLLIGGLVVLATLMIVGVSFDTALPYALLLACPLMMGAMMFAMMRGSRGATPQEPKNDVRDDDLAAPHGR